MAKAVRIAELINISPSDSRFPAFVNEACEALLKRGKYFGTYARYAVAASSQLFTPPPYIDTVERINIAGAPVPIHDLLYQFLSYGWGSRDDSLPNGPGINECLHRGWYPTMVDIPPPGGQLTVKCDVAADVGQQVLLLGYDTSTPPNWIRTQVGGVWQDGEIVQMMQNPGTLSVNGFSKLTGVQPALTGVPLSGQWWLYSGTTLLSNYQWWETQPNYPRYLVPFINSTVTQIEIIGKSAFIPAVKDTDYLSVSSLRAIKLACRAIKAEEEDAWAIANILWNGGRDKKTGQQIIGAIQEMEFELSHFLGDGRVIGLNINGGGYGDDPVPALF